MPHRSCHRGEERAPAISGARASRQHLPQRDTGFNSPCSNWWEEESGQGKHSIPPRPPFGLDTKSTRKFAPTSCLWFTQTRKLFILGQSKRAIGPGRSRTRAVLQMGSLMKELLSCSQAGEGKTQWSQSWNRVVEEGLSSPFHPR